MKKKCKKSDIVKDELNTVKLEQLLPGDILVFQTIQGDTLDEIITSLTHDSDVSHGAVFVQQKDFVLADSGAAGLHAHAMSYKKKKKDDVPRVIFVMRHDKAGKDGILPVSKIAEDYVKQNLPYPFSDLILLGLILLFKKEVKDGLICQAVLDFLVWLAAEIKTKIEKRDGKHTMICSSFVYQCYMDAADQGKNPDLRLNVKNGDAGIDKFPLLGSAPISPNSLLGMLNTYVQRNGSEFKKNLFANGMLPRKKRVRKIDVILKNLHPVLTKQNNEAFTLQSSENLDMFMQILGAVKDVVWGFSSLVRDGVPDFDTAMEDIAKQWAMFITPNDLRYHLTNAKCIGQMTVYRDNDNYDDKLPKQITLK